MNAHQVLTKHEKSDKLNICKEILEVLNTIILCISEYKDIDNLAEFVNGTSYNVIYDIEACIDADAAFVITDSRDTANRAKEKHMGFAAYLNELSKEESFPDALYCVETISDISDETLNRMYLRFMELPWIICETERTIIREITLNDIDDLYRIYSNGETNRYIENLYENREDEIEFTKAYIQNQYRFYEYGMWVIIEKSTGKLIGRAGLSDREGYDTTEIGFVFDRNCWGKGYAYEVCRRIMDYARDELNMEKLISFTYHENERAKNLLERLSFSYVGEREINLGMYSMFTVAL